MLTIKAPSTFNAKVEIPTPGGKPVPVTLTFKHKTRDQLTHFLTSEDAKSRSDADTVAEIVSGWENVDAEFTPDNIDAMLDQYHGAARAILNAYIEQLTQVRLETEGAARYIFREAPTARELAFFGLTLEQATKAFHVMPENDGAVQAFAVLARQWRMGPSGPVGLDYSTVPFVLEMAGVSRDDWQSFFADIRVMEDEALKVLHRGGQHAR